MPTPKDKVLKEFPEGKENYCPRCYFQDEIVILRTECIHSVAPKPKEEKFPEENPELSDELAETCPKCERRSNVVALSKGCPFCKPPQPPVERGTPRPEDHFPYDETKV